MKLPTYNNSAEPFLSVIVQLMIGISIRNSDSGVRVYRVTLSGGGGRLPPLLLMVVELAMGQILLAPRKAHTHTTSSHKQLLFCLHVDLLLHPPPYSLHLLPTCCIG